MADGTDEGVKPADAPRGLRNAAGRFLGSIPPGYAQRNPNGAPGDDGSGRENARPSDAGTIDPVAVSGKLWRDNPAEYRRRRRAQLKAGTWGRKSAEPDAAEAKTEKVAIGGDRPASDAPAKEPPPPDPTLLGFATQGLIFFNAILAARTGAPEFAAISPERSEMVATAWLKFLGYYVSIAKVSGPMGALAAALMATAFVYGPPMMAAAGRRPMPPQAPMPEGPTEGAESMFAAAMPPVH